MANKTPDEKRRYVAGVVRGGDTSGTAPTTLADEGAATDSPLRVEDQATPKKQPARRRSTSRDPSWWEENRKEVWKLGLGGVAAVIAWIVGTTLIGLNREVGQLQQTTLDNGRQLNEMRSNAIRSEDRLESDLRRLRERLDDLRDRVIGRSNSSRGQAK